MKLVEIVGVNVSYGDYGDLVQEVIVSAKKNISLSVAPVAIHPLTIAIYDKDYRKTLNSLDYIVPDSYWHSWSVRLMTGDKTDSFYGPNLLLDLARKAVEERLTIVLFGGSSEKSLNDLKKSLITIGLKRQYIKILLASFSIDSIELEGLRKYVAEVGGDILFIGVGSPKQHEILKNLGNIDIPVIAVGAAFDLLSGKESMSPSWLSRIGLEWLYRLLQNPYRLVRRYLLSMIIFFPRLIFDKLSSIVSRR